jgi:hypothetical protein
MTRDEELVQVDRYLDALLASRYALREATDTGADEELRTTAAAVRRALPRFHPSFAFEERLAHRLRTASGLPAAPTGALIAFPSMTAEQDSAAPARPVGALPRRAGVLLGGAIASGVSIAGVSIAGAALLARRRAKSSAPAV